MVGIRHAAGTSTDVGTRLVRKATASLRRVRYAALLSICCVTACTEVFLTKPSLPLTPQPEIVATPPIALAIVDDEADQRGGPYAAQLAKAIVAAYPRSIVAAEANAGDVAGQISMTIRIHHLGAFFNRTRSPVLTGGQELRVVRGDVADWDQVAAASAPFATARSDRDELLAANHVDRRR